jgi:hypothetical protein
MLLVGNTVTGYLYLGSGQLHAIKTDSRSLHAQVDTVSIRSSVIAKLATRQQLLYRTDIGARLALAPGLNVLEAHSAQQRLDELAAGDAMP